VALYGTLSASNMHSGESPMSPGTRQWLEDHKPHASHRVQLMLAQLMWSMVGLMLFTIGLRWIMHRYGDLGLLYALPFLALGLTKAFLVLDRVAYGAIDRVASRPADACAGGFFSTKSWLLVIGMMATGQVLRASPLPRADIGFLYVAVGTALLFSSRHIWRAWWMGRDRQTVPVR
jgi:hypothetical protein